MTTHKDKPHSEFCQTYWSHRSIMPSDLPCQCGGTRWFNYGYRPDDAIAIQGIATFFARLQPEKVDADVRLCVRLLGRLQFLCNDLIPDDTAEEVRGGIEAGDIISCLIDTLSTAHVVAPYNEAKVAMCNWREDDNGTYDTDCGNRFEFIEGGVADNSMAFCPYCGKTIEEHWYNDWAEGDAATGGKEGSQ